MREIRDIGPRYSKRSVFIAPIRINLEILYDCRGCDEFTTIWCGRDHSFKDPNIQGISRGICLSRLIARSPVESLATGGFISKVGGSMRSIRNLFFVDKITKKATLTPERQMYCLAFCST